MQQTNSLRIMILPTVQLLLMLSMAACYPQSVNILRTPNLSSPRDVNNLAHHHQAGSTEYDPPSLNSLEETVQEVEAMLKSNSNLPRLTRGEILDLLENITRADHKKERILNRNNSTPERGPKAIMVVLPINVENSDGKALEDFYTKAPVTQIVHSRTFHKAEKFKPKQIDTYSLDTDKRNKPSAGKEKKYTNNYKGRPTIFTTVPNYSSTVSTVTKPPNPDRLNEKRIIEFRSRIQQHTSTTLPSSLTKKRRRPRPTSTHSIEKHPNHRYPEQSDSLTVIPAPELSPHVINEDLLMTGDQNNEVLAENESHVSFETVTIREIDLSNDDTMTPSTQMESDIPEYSNNISSDEGVKSVVRVQSHNSEPSKNSSLSQEDEIRHMLASLGVLPPQLSVTTTKIPDDVNNIADNLSPDMKELLMSFDLISRPTKNLTSESQVIDQFNPVEPEIDPQTYVRFKPLPENGGISEDMRDFLAKFGLEKSIRNDKGGIRNKVEDNLLNLEIVPDEFQGVLEDIGLSDRNGKMIRPQSSENTSEKQSFNPSDTLFASHEEIEKLNRLKDIVKELESSKRKITDKDIEKIDIDNIENLIRSLKSLKVDSTIIPLEQQNDLDPNDYNPGVSKKEFKRQEIESSTGSMSTSTLSPSEMLMTPNIKDLEDSFGAESETTDETMEPETTTARRKTGFYYLVDWNSFLDIDDQKGKRVNLRFQPTIGDPKQFYSVSVP